MKIEPLRKKFESFGCKVFEVNGHHHSQLSKVIKSKNKKPVVIIANTIKGKGVKIMENKILWHYRAPTKEQLYTALKKLK